MIEREQGTKGTNVRMPYPGGDPISLETECRSIYSLTNKYEIMVEKIF